MQAIVARLQRNLGFRLPAIDGAWLAVIVILVMIALFDSEHMFDHVSTASSALLSTLPYIVFAVLLLAYLKASGAEVLLAKAFKGQEHRMIVAAALFGGLAPFCSCEVIPFVAGMLALGTPLSAVAAFWLSSPLIDPPSLLITAAALGWPFAVAKAVLAVAAGLFGGYAVKMIVSAGFLTNPLKPRPSTGCCGASKSADAAPLWAFWKERDRVGEFGALTLENGHFLFKWLTLAYLLEALMISYIPAQMVASVVGGDGLAPIALSALVGVPAYLNSYIAPPLVAGLMTQGMSAGAAMAFIMAGAISSIPAMAAVFALVRLPVFLTYFMLGLTAAFLSGILYGAIAGVI